MTRCVIYTRVSSEEQATAGYSLPFQLARLEQYAAESAFEIVARFEDVQTAKQQGREGFNALLRYLEENPNVRDVLVHRMDRLCRNFSDYGLIVEQLGARIRSVVEPAVDGPSGRMFHGMNVVVAKYHSDNLSQEVRKGMRAKFEAGGLPGRAPLGYRNITRTKTRRARIVVDEEAAPVVREVFARYAEGATSLHELAIELFDQGLRTRRGSVFSPQQVKDILVNPFFKGLVTYGAETRHGIQEPLVPASLWDRVQDVLTARSSVRGDKGSKFFLLRGLLVCATCGRKLTAEDHARGRYYHCLPAVSGERCDAPYIQVDALDAKVEALLAGVQMRPDARDALLAELDTLQHGDRARAEQEAAGVRTRLDGVRRKLARLTEGFADGVVSAEEYARLRRVLEGNVLTMEERLATLAVDRTGDVEALRRVLDTASSLATLYELAPTKEDRKALLRRVFKRIVVNEKRIATIEYEPPFHLVLGDARRIPGSTASVGCALLDALAQTGGTAAPAL